MDWNFCYLCGQSLKATGEHSWQCANGHKLYRNGRAATGTFIINDKNEVLVARRAHDPGKGEYDTPGGFVDPLESLEEATWRELKEELGLQRTNDMSLEYIGSGGDTYAWGEETVFVCSSMFSLQLHDDIKVEANDDVASIEWIALEDLNPDDYYFASQIKCAKLLIDKFSAK